MEENTPPPPPSYTTPPPYAPSVPPVITAPPYVRPRGGRGWMVASIVLFVILVLTMFSGLFDNVAGGVVPRAGIQLEEKVIGYSDPMSEDSKGSSDKILVIDISGIIASQSLDGSGNSMVEIVREQLKRAAKNENVKAVILKVNSPGGEVLASDEIYADIKNFQKDSKKPVISSMSAMAASGGYYVSAPCRWIVANELTLTGSIGVIMHGYNYRGLMEKVGLRPEVYKSGKHKNMFSGDRKEEEIPEEERAMIQEVVMETYARFTNIVFESRNAAGRPANSKKLSNEWTTLVDGRVLSGKQAADAGFVDELGNFDTAVKRTLTIANIKDATLVQYEPPFAFGNLFRFFGKANSGHANTVKIDVGLDIPRLQSGYMYFISPSALPR